jgi:hypothetical protein
MPYIFFAAVMIVGAASAAQLRITVYNQALLAKEVSRQAFDDVRKILKASGVDIQLMDGDPRAEEAMLITYPEPPRRGGELEAACLARRDIALEIVAEAPLGRKASVLGTAQPFARKGLNVRVFADRIAAAADRQNRSYSSVLAHVMAHEIGHVLLRTNDHSDAYGLMAPVWTDWEYGQMGRGLMFFNRSQSQAMHVGLEGVNCLALLSSKAGGRAAKGHTYGCKSTLIHASGACHRRRKRDPAEK